MKITNNIKGTTIIKDLKAGDYFVFSLEEIDKGFIYLVYDNDDSFINIVNGDVAAEFNPSDAVYKLDIDFYVNGIA